jgi:hypothetical protein
MAHGVASTARLITGAAAIIIVVFAGFVSGQLVAFQEMGFGITSRSPSTPRSCACCSSPPPCACSASATGTCRPGCHGYSTCRSKATSPPTPPVNVPSDDAPKVPPGAVPVGS